MPERSSSSKPVNALTSRSVKPAVIPPTIDAALKVLGCPFPDATLSIISCGSSFVPEISSVDMPSVSELRSRDVKFGLPLRYNDVTPEDSVRSIVAGPPYP